MGTSRETGVSAWHGFEQSGFIRGLFNEFSRRVVQQMLSEGCPMNVIGGLSNEFYRRLVQQIYIGGLSNGFFYWRFVQWVLKAKIFFFENGFHTWKMPV